MDSNLTTADFLALEGRGYGRGYGYGHGLAAPISFAAAAVIFAGVAAWGINQASKARSKGNARAIDILAGQALADRQSRETWQLHHAPTMTQYVDVQAGAGAGSNAGANALATAEALLLAGNSSRNGQVCPQPVALYQPAMPCSCNTCGN